MRDYIISSIFSAAAAGAFLLDERDGMLELAIELISLAPVWDMQ